MSDEENKKPDENTDETPVTETKTEDTALKKDQPGLVRSIIGAFGKVADKVPEGPLMGHVIPGWMAAHKAISAVIIAGIAIPVAAVVLGAAHAWFNSSYTDDYEALLDDIARESAITCSLDDQDRKEAVYSRVQHDVRDSGSAGVFGIVTAPIGWIPYVGSIVPDFEWLPNKKIYDALATAEANDMRFIRGNGFKKGVEAVIFKDGENPPVMVYKDLDDGQLLAMMKAVRDNGGLQDGALVLSWNDARETFETEHVQPGATEVPVMDGLAVAPMPVNACFNDTSITGRTLDGIKGWIPGMGGDDKEPEEEIVPEEELTPEEKGPGLWGRFFGDKDEESTEEPVAPAEEIAPEATPDLTPEQVEDEQKGPSLFERAKGGFGLWDGEDDESEDKKTDIDSDTPAPAPVPAPQ